jgi:hypothetical protein
VNGFTRAELEALRALIVAEAERPLASALASAQAKIERTLRPEFCAGSHGGYLPTQFEFIGVCLVCGREWNINADGRLRQHRVKS